MRNTVPNLNLLQSEMLFSDANRQTDKHTGSGDCHTAANTVNSSLPNNKLVPAITYMSSDRNSGMLKSGIHCTSSCSRKSSINRVFSIQSAKDIH